MSVSVSTTSLKISMGSVSSNPISDQDELTLKRRRFLFFTLICTTIDFITTILILIKDCNFFPSENEQGKTIDPDPDIQNFIIISLAIIIFFFINLVLLLVKKPILSKIGRFFYLIVGIIHYIFQVTIKIIYFYKNDFYLNSTDIIFFFLVSIVIIPRIIGFNLIKVYERILLKIEQVERQEDHENFLEKIVDKIDRGSKVNNVKASVGEKELDQSQNEGNDEEEIVFTMNDNKVITDNKGNVLSGEEKKEKEN